MACIEAIKLYGDTQKVADLKQHAKGYEGLTEVSRRIAGELGHKTKENIKEATRLCYQIRLRVNSKEHRAIIDIFDELQPKIITDDFLGLQALEERLMVETQHVLGDEWKRVKAGEPTFRITKYIAFIFLIGAIIALISLAISSTSSTETVQDINKPQQKSDPNKLLSKDAEPPISIK